MAYCLIDDVQAEVQRKEPFSTTTHPTILEVGKFMDGVSSQIDLQVRYAGYSLPITEATALAFLKRLNAVGAAAAAVRAAAGHANPNVIGEDEESLYSALLKEFKSMFDRIKPGFFQDISFDKGSYESLWARNLLDGSEEGYSTGGPWFTRDALRER